MAGKKARRGAGVDVTRYKGTIVPPGGSDLNLDYDTGTTSQWASGQGQWSLEAGLTQNPANHQFAIVNSPTRYGTGWCARHEMHNNPASDINFGYRSLMAKYDSDEGRDGGTDFCYGFSFQTNVSPLNYVHIWELHMRANIYNVSPSLALAPHAILLRDGQVQYRLWAGAGQWNGSSWTGYEVQLDQQMILPSYLANTWYDLIIHVKCSETASGVTEVYARQAGSSWPGSPNWASNGPNLPYVPGGLDPAVPTKQDTTWNDNGMSGLYLESGMYTGDTNWGEPEKVGYPGVYMYIDQMRRYTTLAAAKAGWSD